MEAILIVDDNEDLRWNLTQALRDEGYETIAVGNGKRGIKEVKKSPPDLVLLDIMLPGMDGVKVLEEMRKIDKNLIVIMITAYAEVKTAVNAMKLGAYDYITKPFDNEELILAIQRALQTRYLAKEVESLRKKLGVKELMGESPQIKQVLNQVNIIAPTLMTVILQGESGTGKELVAHAVHQQSTRREKPFIPVDCGAIPETLVESELFGYEKGAFTGAQDRKEGAFEQADGGTLFLDEVTNLSNAIQMKLLRVIEERELRHLGGKRNIRIDVRVIVATNTDLSDAVKQGRFRDDLFHRLNEFCINLPLLKDREGDIPILTNYFLAGANGEFGKNVNGISPEAMKLLLDHHWPGNVRELKNVVRRAVLLAESDIDKRHLTQLGAAVKSERKLKDLAQGSFVERTRIVQKDWIEKALEQAGGNKIKAARILQLNRKALYRKMKSLGMPVGPSDHASKYLAV